MKMNKVPLLRKTIIVVALTTIALTLPITLPNQRYARLAQAEGICTAPFIPVSTPLNDLGPGFYIRLTGGSPPIGVLTGPTIFTGGLYPNGQNERPPAHEADGLAIADQIKPINGKIVMISVGMSNTNLEFGEFIDQALGSSYINPQLVLINGAQGSMVSNDWADPNGDPWGKLFDMLTMQGVSKDQVQVAWVKLAQFGFGDFDFPDKWQSLQSDLEDVARNLKSYFPNIKIAFFSSRTRSYNYWGESISPEPTAFETGLSVKGMIEKQINGDPNLNFDSASGPVVAPYLSWGPYLWINGLSARSDGLTWTQEDVGPDCTHPSDKGIQKVVNQLINFFSYDSLTKKWFLADPNAPPPPPGTFSEFFFLPGLLMESNTQVHP
jgi:hypothetical protein